MPRRHNQSFLLLAPKFLSIFIAAYASAQTPAVPKLAPDPLIADPAHVHLEFENQWVRVFKEHMAPDDSQPMHQHPGPGAVIIFLTDRHNQLTYFDGSKKIFQNHAGDVMWSAPSTHQSKNLMNANFAALQIEPRPVANPKPFPQESTDALVVDPKHYQLLLENEWVRAIRVTVGPHEKLIMHKHPATGAVVVNLSDLDMRQFHADGKPHENHYKAGTVRWVGPDDAHQDENLSDKPFQLIRVEIKQAQN